MDGGNCMGLEAKDAMFLRGLGWPKCSQVSTWTSVWLLGAVTPTETAENPDFP